jgi:hypothetical protein
VRVALATERPADRLRPKVRKSAHAGQVDEAVARFTLDQPYAEIPRRGGMIDGPRPTSGRGEPLALRSKSELLVHQNSGSHQNEIVDGHARGADRPREWRGSSVGASAGQAGKATTPEGKTPIHQGLQDLTRAYSIGYELSQVLGLRIARAARARDPDEHLLRILIRSALHGRPVRCASAPGGRRPLAHRTRAA